MQSGTNLSNCDVVAIATQCPLSLELSATIYGMEIEECAREPIHWQGLLAVDSSLRLDWARSLIRGATAKTPTNSTSLPADGPRPMLEQDPKRIEIRGFRPTGRKD